MRPKYKKIRLYGKETFAIIGKEHINNKICMCYDCKRFIKDDRDNCPIAQAIYDLCVHFNVTTPVTRCEFFIPINQKLLK